MADTTLISVRVPKKVAKRLATLAGVTDRSLSYVAAQAIEEFLSLHEWQVKAIRQGLEEAEAGELVGHDAAKRKLSKWKGRGT